MNNIPIRAKRLTSRLDIPALAYATAGSSGLDLYANIDEPVSLRGGGAATIPVGYAVEIPEGFEGQIRGRSGLAKNDHIGVTNGIGTIDSDYRGELAVLLSHHGHLTEHKWIMPGEKIAQLVIMPVMHADIEMVDELSETDRGTNGFGSTGDGLTKAAPDAPAGADPVIPEQPAPVVVPPVTGETQTITGADVGDAAAALGNGSGADGAEQSDQSKPAADGAASDADAEDKPKEDATQA